MSKLLLQLVASHRDGFYIMQYDNDDDFLLKHTVDQLNITFHPTDLVILRSIEEIPDFLIDMHRRQCKSDLLLDWLLSITTFKNDENDKQLANLKGDNNNNVKLLVLCNFDAYSNGLNFVFGQAHMNGKVAAVYLARLRQEFYGLEKNQNLFLQRVLKEAVHETGHAFGLGHCPVSRCVMHFSNSISDTDAKAKDFCQDCRIKIDDRL
ncbi:MAG TPA: archaemetzincin family Zn-dependent metalloprotease [Nitrososphaeraceae archaeon]|nr:archaemetzincin family Zn-dependent metalloprotease [Nitrososphaeraceae archaeon]